MALTGPSLERLDRLLRDADSAELASWNTALWRRCEDPLLRMHLDPARANVLRAMDIPQGSRVLEISAGAGAITRYLGETASTVDAVEGDPDLAPLLALRVRGLTTVTVHSALDDIPADRRYDLIVAVDALRGTVPNGRAALLSELTRRLAPSGKLAIAESNALGSKYLVGSRDDETGRPFDSVEGYPAGTAHPAVTRHELAGLLRASGLIGDFLPALPDHRYGRTVVHSAALPDGLRRLATDLTVLPSPDHGRPRPRLADERAVWPRLVDAGLDVEHANSWLVLARVGTAPVAPLGQDVLAAFDSWQRSERYTAHSRVLLDGSGLRVERRYPHRDAAARYYVEDSVTPYATGPSLLEELVEADPEQWKSLLDRWRTAVEELWTTRVWLDVHPGNFIVGPSGELVAIDLEFGGTDADREFGLRRSLLATARSIAVGRRHGGFPEGVETIEQLAVHLASLVGIPRSPRWVPVALDAEAVFQAEVAGDPDARSITSLRVALREQFRTRLDVLAISSRDYEVLERVIADRDASFARAGELDARIRELEGLAARSRRRIQALSRHVGSLERKSESERVEARDLEIELRNVAHHWYLEAERLRLQQESWSVRHALAARAAVSRALPAGSRRGRLLAALLRRG